MNNAFLNLMLRQETKRHRTIKVPDITRFCKDPSMDRVLFSFLLTQYFYRTSFLYRNLLGFTRTPISIFPHLNAQGRACFAKDCS
jgi:hypothetical protein